MAETKKAREIRARKQDLLTQIAGANDAILDAAKRVPDHVIYGSYQTAVTFKDTLEAATRYAERAIPKRATVESLKSNLTLKMVYIRTLRGEA